MTFREDTALDDAALAGENADADVIATFCAVLLTAGVGEGATVGCAVRVTVGFSVASTVGVLPTAPAMKCAPAMRYC